MHLYYFLAVVISLSCGSIPGTQTEPLRPLLASAGMIVAWILLCHVGARVIAKQVAAGAVDASSGATLLDRQLDAFRWLGLGVTLLCLAGFGLE